MMEAIPPKTRLCPRTGFDETPGRSCRELVSDGKCMDRWVFIQGEDPNTGEPVVKFGCVDDWAWKMQMDTNRAMGQVVASQDKTATEIRKFHGNMAHMNGHQIDENADMHGAPRVPMSMGRLAITKK